MRGVPCYGFSEDLGTPELYDPSLETCFGEILEDFKPDMIHVFGTEFPHALAAVRAFGKPERTLVGIQGLCYKIAEVYMAKLPETVCGDIPRSCEEGFAPPAAGEIFYPGRAGEGGHKACGPYYRKDRL